MNKIGWVIAVMVVLLGAQVMAVAESDYSHEASFSASYVDIDLGSVHGSDLGDLEQTDMKVKFGWFFSGNHEVGFLAGYTKFEYEDLSADGITYGAFYDYNFSTNGNAIPFVGVNVAGIGGDLGDFYNFAYSFEVGVKFYPWEHAGIVFSASYGSMNGDYYDLPDADVLGIGAGLLVRF